MVIDQSTGTGWVSLGTYDFAADGDEWVRLDDNTGEAFDAQRVLVFDALRVVPLDVGGGDTGDGGQTSGGDGSGGGGSGGVEEGGDVGGDGVGGSSSGASALPGLDGTGSGGDGGCACASDPRGSRLGWGWIAVVFVACRRRRD